MKKNYQIQGMSCCGCVKSVKNALLQVPNVTQAEVHVNPQGATITMSKDIDVENLQTQLNKSGHYTIKEVINN